MRHAVLCYLLLASASGCAASETETPPDVASGESDLFGVGETKVSFKVKLRDRRAPIAPGTPICFEVDARKATSLFDLSGASTLHDGTDTPFLFLPKGSFPGVDDDYVGVGKVCAGIDRNLYLTAKEYVSGSNYGGGTETKGEEHVFRVGALSDEAPTTLEHGLELPEQQAFISGSFVGAFREEIAKSSAGAAADSASRFVITPKPNTVVTELSRRPELLTTP